MNFVEYMKNKARMVKMDKFGDCTIKCEDCPLGGLNNGKEMYCLKFEHLYPEEAVVIVEKWTKENPVKTYLSEFLGYYPNARANEDGVPNSCPHDLYKNIGSRCPENISCYECWNRPVEGQFK